MAINSLSLNSTLTSYNKSIADYKSNLSQLASGQKKITADPAGLGISERLRALVSSTQAARSNISRASSMLSTSSGWMGGVQESLSRMKELAIQANGGTLSATDKESLESEFKQHQDYITSVTSGSNALAQFNGISLLRGGDGQAGEGDQIEGETNEVQVGPENEQTIDLENPNLDVTNDAEIGSYTTFEYDANNQVTGSTTTDVAWDEIINSETGIDVDDDDAIAKLDEAINFVAEKQSTNASQQNRLDEQAEALLSSEDNLRESESKIRDVDEAYGMMQNTKLLIQAKVAQSVMTQGFALNSQSLLSLLQSA